ncbi:MAG: ribose 5-phosphate isomerase [Bacteroidota bacterium]|jgi:ribose 5-phosphate isomerase B
MSNWKHKIAIGADHAGFDYKTLLIKHLHHHALKDFGTYTTDSVDYPDFSHPVAEAVEKGESDLGILICGSANGVAMAANKHQGIRAAICWTEELAALARSHNNANVLCIPARFISPEVALKITDTFLNTDFEGGRHQNRVDKISC